MATQPSFYKLKPEWVLRGWENLPHALVNTENGQLSVLDDATFFAAAASDGQTDFDLPIFLDVHRKAHDRLIAAGIVDRLDTPSPLSEFQRYRKAPNPYYKALYWSVTGSCNLRCRHCCLHAPDRKYEDLSFREILQLVDEMGEAGIMEISITGGEPFFRKDIWDILACLAEKRIRISRIHTNGVLVSSPVLERLASVLGPQGAASGRKVEFSLSFDGVVAHDDMRGIRGTEEKTLTAIERIRAHGFPVSIETALYRKNVDRMADTLRLLTEKGVEAWKISGVSDVGKWLETGGVENLTVREIFEGYLGLLKTFISLGRPISIRMGGFYHFNKTDGVECPPCGRRAGKSGEHLLKQFACNACRFIRYLLPDGTLLPCIPMTGTHIHKNMPGIRGRGLVAGLRDPSLWKIVSLRVEDLVERNEECAGCEHLGACGLGCRASALTCGEGVFAKDPVACLYWKEGYPGKIMECIDGCP